MARITATELAKHIAAILDGDWDDGLEAHVAAMSKDGVVEIDLAGDGGEHLASFRIAVEKVD